MLNDLKEWTCWLAKWFCIAVVISWGFGQTPFGKDDSDNPGWFASRSGVEPVSDRLTGCQYLRTLKGGITPRLGANGKQVGCKS